MKEHLGFTYATGGIIRYGHRTATQCRLEQLSKYGLTSICLLYLEKLIKEKKFKLLSRQS